VFVTKSASSCWPDFVDANTSTCRFVVERDRYVDG
jgi:hypothetical protein